MARQRLTKRVAEDLTVKGYGDSKESKGSGINNDPYTMNDTGHEANDPKMDEYMRAGDDPYGNWAEKPHDKNPAVDDSKREETGHAPLVDRRTASEAVASARKLEEKAVKCIVASQRILPGASDDDIEAQAAVLMHLTDEGLNSTLSRQEKLAQSIGKVADETAEEVQEDPEVVAKREKLASLKKEAEELEKELSAGDESEEKEAAKKEDEEEACDMKSSADEEDEKKDEKEEDKEASKEEDKEASKEEDKEAATDEDKEASKEEDKEASKEEDKEASDDEEGEDEKEEEDEEEGKDASDDSLLDSIFSSVTASSNKKGATKISGLVKKEASEAGVDNLGQLWGTPPDVSDVFGN